jgi:mRNA degradation ribonuclease J1/J2
MESASKIIRKVIRETPPGFGGKNRNNSETDNRGLKNRIRDALSDYIYTQTKRSPMILPVIFDS